MTNWDAVGAIGEVVGAFAVVTTLLILLIQVRQNTKSMVEANRLQKAAAIDKHAESIGIWRSQFIESQEVSDIWIAARDGKPLDSTETLRFDNMWVNFVNTQRSNFVRANVVGEAGLALQASRSIAVEISMSPNFKKSWENTRNWHQLASPDFVESVENELAIVEQSDKGHRVPGSLDRVVQKMEQVNKNEVE